MAGLRSDILACLHIPRIKAHSARERAYRCFKQARLMELPPIWNRFFCVIGLQSDHIQAVNRRLFNQLLYTTLITISAFSTIDHSNCVDVSKCSLACTDRAREVPKHISVQGRFSENNPRNYNFYKTFVHNAYNVGLPLPVCVPQHNSF